jgi:hypothetical protein
MLHHGLLFINVTKEEVLGSPHIFGEWRRRYWVPYIFLDPPSPTPPSLDSM